MSSCHFSDELTNALHVQSLESQILHSLIRPLRCSHETLGVTQYELTQGRGDRGRYVRHSCRLPYLLNRIAATSYL